MKRGNFVCSLLCFAVAALLCSRATATSFLRNCPSVPFTPRLVRHRADADLKVLVPNRRSLQNFVDCRDLSRVRGFCIDAFELALSLLLPHNLSTMRIHYTCFNFSAHSGSGPSYDDMVDAVANGPYDALVGDTTIAAQRVSKLAFTQQYMESGIVILMKSAQEHFDARMMFAFPFTARMWEALLCAFGVMGLLLCLFEYESNSKFTCQPLIQRVSNTTWFVFEALLLLERTKMKSMFSHFLMVIWVSFVLLLSSSYAAGLGSYLTATNLSPTTYDITYLKNSGMNIGYRSGSIVKDFLTTRFQIQEKKLRPLRNSTDYLSALTSDPSSKGVLAIVDEIPYARMILPSLLSHSCNFAIIGPQISREGFGFGFKDLDLAQSFSSAILKLTQSGCLKVLQEKDLFMNESKSCSTSISQYGHVRLKNLLLIFIPYILICFAVVLVHFTKNFLSSRKKRITIVDQSLLISYCICKRHINEDIGMYNCL